MSYYEALKDNIHTERHNGEQWYYPPCSVCGKPIPSWNYASHLTYICRECRKTISEKKSECVKGYNHEKQTRRLSLAIKRISKVTNIDMYNSAIEKIRKSLHRKGWFQSTEEIMTAIELLKNNLKVYHQVKIYNYTVDFIVPKYKAVLEIDGKIFHNKNTKDYSLMRDELITQKMGAGWNVIHIDTENINKNITKLIPAIEEVLKQRKKTNSSV